MRETACQRWTVMLYFPSCAGIAVNGYYFYGMQRYVFSAFCHGVNEVPALLGCVADFQGQAVGPCSVSDQC